MEAHANPAIGSVTPSSSAKQPKESLLEATQRIAGSGPQLGSNRVIMTVGSGPDSIATISQSMSFDVPYVSAFHIRNLPPWAGRAMTSTNMSQLATSANFFNGTKINGSKISVHGFGFERNDATLRVAFGYTVSAATAWTSDSVIFVTIGKGLERSHRIVITGGNGLGSLTQALSFDAAVVILSNKTGTEGFENNLPVRGGVLTTIHGYSFGSDLSRSAEARIG